MTTKLKYYIDIDGTICKTPVGDYTKSVPIYERIEKVNELYDAGNTIILWTARGARSGKDYRDLTLHQLKLWGVKYTSLSVGEKPDYDVLIDDKSHNVDNIWKLSAATDDYVPPELPPMKKVGGPQEIVEKTWGSEVVIINSPLYCGKILKFRAGYTGSFHFHLKKTETWYISNGRILLSWPDPATGKVYTELMRVGDVVTHRPGEAHIVEAIEDCDIFEISTQHFDEDTYRIGQKRQPL
jgi:mannose-6-phosphate isomerase-like protein (cupin superfamily)